MCKRAAQRQLSHAGVTQKTNEVRRRFRRSNEVPGQLDRSSDCTVILCHCMRRALDDDGERCIGVTSQAIQRGSAPTNASLKLCPKYSLEKDRSSLMFS